MGAVKEFVPKGMVVKTDEQFMGLDALDDEQPKKKKGKKGKAQVQQQAPKQEPAEETDELLESLPFKGKSSQFFIMNPMANVPDQPDPNNPMNFELNDEQWRFVFKYYPEYGGAPYEIMAWLYNEAQAHEYRIEEEKAAYSGKPRIGGVVGVDDEEEDDPFKGSKRLDKGFDKNQQKKKNTQKQIEEQKRIANEKRIAELKEKVKPGVSDAQKAENKIIKAFKDKEVNLNPDGITEVDTTREPISMVFIGHVDAGKSTISGNLMYLMGVVDQRTIDKYKAEAKDKGRDSWWLAYVMDVSDDEKAKGKTVEVGRATFDTPSKKYTIFDAPGHKNYVPNMIMGAALADVAGLVISARKGEFEAGFEKDGQTREHAQLAKSLGVQKLVVIVNKMDDCKWSKTRYDEIQTGLLPFLKNTGYKESDIIWIPIAGITGENIDKKVESKVCNWYDGPTFIELLDQIPLEPRFPKGPLRVPIIDKMKDKDIIAHGKVENGTISLGDKLAIMPSGAPAQVIALNDGKGNLVKYAGPGENV